LASARMKQGGRIDHPYSEEIEYGDLPEDVEADV
jgi:hypothetical protein